MRRHGEGHQHLGIAGQGLLVLLSNPKVLVFFGAFIPQFVDMEKDHISQVALLGVTFMVIAGLTDAIYALLAGRARQFFSVRRTQLLSRISGGFMIGGGIWLALTRARRALPDIPWFAYAIVLSPAVLILGAAAWKYLQVRAARDWPSTPGKVVVSAAEVRDVEVIDDSRNDRRGHEQRNFANIVYEYTVSGQKLRNSRVSIGEDRGNFEVAETLARYPVGTDVIVYYNPRHPRDAVLERDLPKGTAGCLIWGIVIVLALVFGGAFGGKHMADYVAAHLANPKLSPLVMALGAFGFFIALFGLALHRQSKLARSWPVVPGVVKLSGVETYQSADRDTASASGAVRVFVNPANPTDSTLNPGGTGAWFLWAVALGFAVAAFYVAPLGIVPETAASAEEGLERLAHEVFDIVLMDVYMPDMDGREATRRLRAEVGPNQTVPVIAITASATERDWEACRAAGMNGH
eukprot:gene36371-48991_t